MCIDPNVWMQQKTTVRHDHIVVFHFRTASKHVDKDLGNIEENKKLEENNHKSEA